MNLQDQQLVAAAFEGALDEAGFQRLQERMRQEPGLVALYREHALLHHSLCEEFEGRHMMGDALPRVAGRPWKALVLLGAAALLLGFAGWGWKFVFPSAGSRAAAGWDLSADAIATVDGRPATADSGLTEGSRISVERGWVRLNWPGDTVVSLGAPATVVIQGDRALHLATGRVRVRCPGDKAGFTVTTSLLGAVGRAAEFGVASRPGTSDEVHAFRGKVEVTAAAGGAVEWLAEQEAVTAEPGGTMKRMPSREGEFESLQSESRLLLEDRFETGTTLAGRRPAVGDSQWRLERGAPEWKGSNLEGGDFEAYFSLPSASLSSARPVLLATLETVATADFHTPGWAGFSLYQDGYEVCFFGDSYGPEKTWSLDVKRSLYPLMPEPYVTGPRTMTLRYDRRDGTIEVHEGPEPGADPLVRSKILPGLTFDQVRIGASAGASLGLSRLTVRAVEATSAR